MDVSANLLSDAIANWAALELKAQAQMTEALLVEAIRLQEFDQLDRLTVVDQLGHSPAVASLL